jgi:oligopeptide transport system substrate-binding protein
MLRSPALVAVAALLAAGCDCSGDLARGEYFGTPDPDPDPTVLRWCNSGEPESVDPALATSTTSTPLARLMFAGLAEPDTDMDGTPTPMVATRWEASVDQRTFTFYLRDDARWSDGQPLTAHDFVYHVARILHPKSISRNVQPLEPIKNAMAFNGAKVKMLLEDSPPFSAGDIVEVVSVARDPDAGNRDRFLDQALPVLEGGGVSLPARPIPDTNARKSSRPLHLRDLGAPESEAYAVVPPGDEVDLVELGGPRRDWAYVFWFGDNWRYGWVPLADLDVQPHGTIEYNVREVPPQRRLGTNLAPDPDFAPREGVVPGSRLLMVPEVLGIRAEGDHKLVIETASPTPYLIDDSTNRIFQATPRRSVARDPKGWTQPDKGLLVTSGPFTMTKWLPRDRMEFDKSPTFFNADQIKLERFIAYNMNDQAASANLYFQGGCDAVTSNNVPNSYLPLLFGEGDDEQKKDFTNIPYLGIYFYVINTEKLTNVHLRRAMSMAIDREPISELLHQTGFPGASFTPGRPLSMLTPEERRKCGIPEGETRGTAAFITPEDCYHSPPGLELDLEGARRELELARKEMGDTFPRTLELKFNTGVEQHKVIAEYIQDQWKKNLGLDFILQVQEWQTYLADTTAGNFQVGRLGWIGSTPDPESQFLIIFRCNDGKPSPYNRSRWCSPEFNRLYEQAQQILDRGERLAVMRRAEEVVAREVPLIPLYVYTQRHLRKPYLRDMPMNLADQTTLYRTWIDPDWERGEDGR